MCVHEEVFQIGVCSNVRGLPIYHVEGGFCIHDKEGNEHLFDTLADAETFIIRITVLGNYIGSSEGVRCVRDVDGSEYLFDRVKDHYRVKDGLCYRDKDGFCVRDVDGVRYVGLCARNQDGLCIGNPGGHCVRDKEGNEHLFENLTDALEFEISGINVLGLLVYPVEDDVCVRDTDGSEYLLDNLAESYEFIVLHLLPSRRKGCD